MNLCTYETMTLWASLLDCDFFERVGVKRVDIKTFIYGTDGFRMSDGTHKITKYDMTFIFWMVVNCLLRSKFVGYTANFTENSEVIIDGANVFFGQQVSRTHPSQGNDNNICVGGIPGYFDPFVDNKIDLAEESMKGLLNKDMSSGHSGDSLNRTNLYSNASDISMNCGSGAGFMTDEGSAFPIVAKHLVGLIFWIGIILPLKSSVPGMAFPTPYNIELISIRF